MAYVVRRGVVLLIAVALCSGSVPAVAGTASMRHLREDDREERLPEVYQTRRQVKRERTEASRLQLPIVRNDTVLLLPVDFSETDLSRLSLDEAGALAYRERETAAFREELIAILGALPVKASAVEGVEALPEEVEAARAWRVTWKVTRVAPGKKKELYFIQVTVCNAADPAQSAEYEDAGPRERVLGKFRLRLDKALKRVGRG